MQRFSVTGMSCAACSAHVEKAVQAVPGVTSVTVSLLTNSMSVEFVAPATEQQICDAVAAAGYGVAPENAAQQPSPKAAREALEDHETPKMMRRLVASTVLLLPLMYVSMGVTMWGWPAPAWFAQNPLMVALYQMVLTAAVMVINQKFFINGTLGLIHKAPNMDTLVALGSAASFAYSTVVTFLMAHELWNGNPEATMHHMHDLYFESAAMILTLITVGKMLEAHSKGKTTNAIKSLMDLAPKTARVRRDGEEVEIPAEQVQVGDVFVVRPGESIPVDGEVIEGESAVNEAALTGESLPVDKAEGSLVSAATLNQNGFLVCRATRVGGDTTLSQIIRMVEDASATKAPIAKIADKVSGVFVPVVISIALITFAGWMLAGHSFGFALARGISVLVISCPCALGLATPVAIMVGSGKGAKNGILFKTAAVLEAAGKTDIVVLDKTGTVTEGKPRVTDILPAKGVEENGLLEIASALEGKSEHPLARAVCEESENRQIAVQQATGFAALPGHGVQGMVNGKTALGGNAVLMAEKGLLTENWQQLGEKLSEQGKTPLYFAYDGKMLGIIAVADALKPDSKDAIAQMKGMGVHVVMLTGDNCRTADAIGAQAGVEHVIADVLPGDKEAVVRALQKSGKVAMVGDGINDAPALTRADVGIAIGAGADVALDAADVVLMRSNLMDVAASMRLSRQVLRNIHENLFWAFIYNTIGIPVAAGLLYPIWGIALNPMLGAAAMSLSSFCVVTNALRLNLFDLRNTRHDGRKKAIPLPEFLAEDRTPKACPLNLAAKQEEDTNETEEETVMKTIHIEGMMCKMCVAHVQKALEDLGLNPEISLENGTAVVNGDVSDEALTKAITNAGYTVTGIDGAPAAVKTIHIEGMMCKMCVAHVQKALEALGLNPEISLENGTAVVSGNVSDEDLTKAVTEAGYTVTSID